MINTTFFIIILGLFGLFWFLLAVLAAKKIKNTTDYFLAGNELGIIPLTLTLMATQIGGGFLSGIAQESYVTGFYGALYALGISSGFIALGLGVASRLKALNIKTTAELFETRYRSTTLKKIASLLSIISLWGILVAQIVAFKTIMLGLGITQEWVTILFWLSIIGHTVIGGFKAVVLVDIFKQVFIIVMFVGIFLYSLYTNPLLPHTLPDLFSIQHMFGVNKATILELIPIFLMPALFCLIEQDLAQCFFAARNKSVAAVSAFWASIFLILFSAAPVYLGMYAKVLNLPVAIGANPLIVSLAHITSATIFILGVMALIAAITSTANSLLCAVSGNITQDFNIISEKNRNSLFISKMVTLIAGVAALIASYLVSKNILGILTISYELSVSCLFIPSIIAYYRKDVSRTGAIGSLALGAFGFFIFRLYPPSLPKELATLCLSLIGYIVGSYKK